MANYALLHIINLDEDCDYSIAVYFDGTPEEILSTDWQAWANTYLAFSALVDNVSAVELPCLA